MISNIESFQQINLINYFTFSQTFGNINWKRLNNPMRVMRKFCIFALLFIVWEIRGPTSYYTVYTTLHFSSTISLQENRSYTAVIHPTILLYTTLHYTTVVPSHFRRTDPILQSYIQPYYYTLHYTTVIPSHFKRIEPIP